MDDDRTSKKLIVLDNGLAPPPITLPCVVLQRGLDSGVLVHEGCAAGDWGRVTAVGDATAKALL